MRLHDNQLKLIHYLVRFNFLDYPSCLHILDERRTENQVALSYVFRPLTKNKYLTKRKDGSVAILAKGRAQYEHVYLTTPKWIQTDIQGHIVFGERGMYAKQEWNQIT